MTGKGEVAEILNNYFIEVVQKLEIQKCTCEHEQQTPSENIDGVIDQILDKYKSHPSI